MTTFQAVTPTQGVPIDADSVGESGVFRPISEGHSEHAEQVAPDGTEGPKRRRHSRRTRARISASLQGNRRAVTHGAHDRRALLAFEATRRERRAQILADRGIDENDVPMTLSIIIDRFIEATFFAESYFAFVARSGGPITTKGRQRRAVDGWNRACDRVDRLASKIGLTRQTRDVNLSPVEWLRQHADGVDE